MVIADHSDEPPAPEQPADSSQLLILGGATIGLLLLWDLLDWLGQGGFFAMISALLSVDSRVPSIDVDQIGLRFPISVVLCVAILALCHLCDADITRRGPQLLVMLGIVGGGYLLAELYDEPIVTRYMTAHGYSRCTSRDHRVGYRKSRVWLDDYVLAPADCPAS